MLPTKRISGLTPLRSQVQWPRFRKTQPGGSPTNKLGRPRCSTTSTYRLGVDLPARIWPYSSETAFVADPQYGAQRNRDCCTAGVGPAKGGHPMDASRRDFLKI